jgi:hypothetical protein
VTIEIVTTVTIAIAMIVPAAASSIVQTEMDAQTAMGIAMNGTI